VKTLGGTHSRVRASVVELAGRPRVVYVNTAGAMYAECLSGCQTPTPTWSTPVAVVPGGTDRESRPLLRASGGVLSGMSITAAGEVLHGECPSNCTSAASWTGVDIAGGVNGSHTVSYDVLGSLRVAVIEDTPVNAADGGGAMYLECTSGCTSALTSWRPALYFPHDPSGADIRLTALPDGGVRRSAAIFADEANVIRYGECEANCLQSGSWSFVSLAGNAKDPDLVFDAQGLPRIFAVNRVTNRVFVFRCTARPCTTSGNWISTNLIDGNHVTGGNLPDGGTFFLTSTADAGALLLGVEAGATYAVTPINLCSGAAAGERPHGYAGANGRLRAVWVTPPGNTPTINFLYQAP
jgi:hypothetical protein